MMQSMRIILATGIVEKDKKIQAVMRRSIMGGECRHVYWHNLSLTAEQREDSAAVLGTMEGYFKPAKNIIYKRYLFGCCKQVESELIDAFVTKLREKASCDYGQLKDEMIREKIVLGIADESTRRRLLREKDLSLVAAIGMCRAAEQTDIRMRAMETTSFTMQTRHREQFHDYLLDTMGKKTLAKTTFRCVSSTQSISEKASQATGRSRRH